MSMFSDLVEEGMKNFMMTSQYMDPSFEHCLKNLETNYRVAKIRI